MGEMADYYMDLAMEEYYDHKHISDLKSKSINSDYKKGKLFWSTKSGEKINVKDMTVSHIENTIRLIVNKSDDLTGSSKSWVEVLTEELNRRDNG